MKSNLEKLRQVVWYGSGVSVEKLPIFLRKLAKGASLYLLGGAKSAARVVENIHQLIRGFMFMSIATKATRFALVYLNPILALKLVIA